MNEEQAQTNFPQFRCIIVLLKMKNGAFAPFYSWLIVESQGM